MSLTRSLNAVKAFHRRVGSPVSDFPTLLPGDRQRALELAGPLSVLSVELLRAGATEGDLLHLRVGMALEELSEWLRAHGDGDLVAAADAWADRAYVLLGDAVAAGLPAEPLFEAVHASNLSKSADPAGGKAVKGLGFFRPDIASVLRRHRHP